MRAIGAGTGLSVLGGSAIAADDSNDDGTDDGDDSDDDGADCDDDSDGSGTVHEVQTLIRAPPTNPNRPADFFYQPTGLHVQPGDVVKFVFTFPDHNVVSYHPAFGMRRRMPTFVDPISSPLKGWRPSSIPGDQIEPPGEGSHGGDDSDDDTDDGNGGNDDTNGGDDSDDGNDDGGDDTNGDDTNGGDDGNGDDRGPVPDVFLQSFETEGVYDILCSPHEGFGMAMRVVVGDVAEAPFETSNPENLPEPRAGPVGLARLTLTDPMLEPATIVDMGEVRWEALAANQPPESTEE